MTIHADPPAPSIDQTNLVWGDDVLSFEFAWDADSPVRLDAIRISGVAVRVHAVAAVDVLTTDSGHTPASYRLAHTATGNAQRYIAHEFTAADTLVIRQRGGGVTTELRLERAIATRAVRATVTVTSLDTTVVLRSVTSWSSGFTAAPANDDAIAGWDLLRGRNDWLGEGRWHREPLRPDSLPDIAEHLTGHNPRGAVVATSQGTWSTGADLPTGGLVNADHGLALAWQVEHNGAWRWEVGEDTAGGYLALSGPTDRDSSWTQVLHPGQSFTTVPATVAFGTDLDGAFSSLTDHRRATRRPHPDNDAMPVVFNDYMNTLDGDPTTEKLLPLIDAAAEAGAQVFCIDAGWYDDSGDWWDSVGLWEPSTTRFPGGLDEVIDAIRDRGMVPGLWVEPEVVGINSPAADLLPAEAFLQRHGQRVVEHQRFHLDLRHPAAVAHLDAVIDRLIADFGVGFFKFDYNIDPGTGTDLDADSPGAGLLGHNRAHLAWLDALLDRHPELIIENCGSGAMRMDYAILSRLAMQSTSDQQDYRKYPPIAASAPLSMLPEQAASWAYPQPDMDAEQSAFCLVTGLLGRYYVSGHLDRMTPPQRERVATAVAVAAQLRPEIAASHPHWPLGLPEWDAPWVALGLRTTQSDLVSVWRRGGGDTTTLLFPHLVGHDIEVTTVFPRDLPAWHTEWDASTGALRVQAADARIAARTLRLSTRTERSTPASAPDHTDHIEGAIQ